MFVPFLRRSIMKCAKLILFIALAFLVTESFGAKLVKSKLGDIDVTSEKGGGKVVCTVSFNDELTIVKDSGTEVLVKGRCGQGWVAKSKVEYVAADPGDKVYNMSEFNVQAWIDNPTGIFVLEDDAADFDGVSIDRDFKEYLTYTMDREQTEMRNGEN